MHVNGVAKDRGALAGAVHTKRTERITFWLAWAVMVAGLLMPWILGIVTIVRAIL